MKKLFRTLLLLLFLTLLLVVPTITFKVQVIDCDKDVNSLFDQLKNQPMLFNNFDKQIEQILTQQDKYSLESIEIQLPSTLKIRLNEKNMTELMEKDPHDQNLFEQALKEENINYQNVEINNGEITITLDDNRKVLIEEEPYLAIKKLGIILRETDFTQFDKHIGEIDLRYDLPILR